MTSAAMWARSWRLTDSGVVMSYTCSPWPGSVSVTTIAFASSGRYEKLIRASPSGSRATPSGSNQPGM